MKGGKLANDWTTYGLWALDELQAVSAALASLENDDARQDDKPDREALVRFALRMHRRGFRDPAKLAIVCRKAGHLRAQPQIS